MKSDDKKMPETTMPTQNTVTGATTASTGSVVSLNYTLRTDSPTGAIQETTLESIATANGLFKTGATYKPFQVALGQGQVIVGFEAGLMGMTK
jgi:FKBP-type peptidyl-prolyl cis-trans isomerase 2